MGGDTGRRPSFIAQLPLGSARHELNWRPVLRTGGCDPGMDDQAVRRPTGWAPSTEIRNPRVALALVKFGKGGMALVARLNAGIAFGSKSAKPIAAALGRQ